MKPTTAKEYRVYLNFIFRYIYFNKPNKKGNRILYTRKRLRSVLADCFKYRVPLSFRHLLSRSDFERYRLDDFNFRECDTEIVLVAEFKQMPEYLGQVGEIQILQ